MAPPIEQVALVVQILVGLSVLLPPAILTLTSRGRAWVREKFHLTAMEQKIDNNGTTINRVGDRVEQMEARQFALIAAHSDEVDLDIERIEADAAEQIDMGDVNRYLTEDQFFLRSASDD